MPQTKFGFNPEHGPAADVIEAAEAVYGYMEAMQSGDHEGAKEKSVIAAALELPLSGYLLAPTYTLENRLHPLSNENFPTQTELNDIKRLGIRAGLRCYVYSGFPVEKERVEQFTGSHNPWFIDVRTTLLPKPELIKTLTTGRHIRPEVFRQFGFGALIALGIEKRSDRWKSNRLDRKLRHLNA